MLRDVTTTSYSAPFKPILALCKPAGIGYTFPMKQPSSTIDAKSTDLIRRIREIVLSARALAARSIDTIQVSMNFAIGQRIVEHEQAGEKRAAYGQRVLANLAAALTAEFGRGFSLTNLKLMRQFYLAYSAQIGQNASDQSLTPDGLAVIMQSPSAQSTEFSLSWSHYVILVGLGMAPPQFTLSAFQPTA